MAAGMKRMGRWDMLRAIALVLLVAIVAVELFGNLAHEQAIALEIAEILCICIIAADLAVKFWKAKSKARFLRENWFEFLILLPFGAIFESLKALEAFRMVQGLEILKFGSAIRGAGHFGGLLAYVPLIKSKEKYVEITEDMMQ